MIAPLDPVALEQESRRMETALTPLSRFVRGGACRDQPTPGVGDEPDRADVSVAEFRRDCSWE
jgi:hypothetical protein